MSSRPTFLLATLLPAARLGEECSRYREHALEPPNCRNAHKAVMPSCCAATFESTDAFCHTPGSIIQGVKHPADSSGEVSNSLEASQSVLSAAGNKGGHSLCSGLESFLADLPLLVDGAFHNRQRVDVFGFVGHGGC